MYIYKGYPCSTDPAVVLKARPTRPTTLRFEMAYKNIAQVGVRLVVLCWTMVSESLNT